MPNDYVTELDGYVLKDGETRDSITDVEQIIGDMTPIRNQYPDLNQVFSVAHRGAASHYKTILENTVEAFEMARRQGYRWVETDIQHTSDHVPVLCHNATINVNETADTITIANTTWETLSGYTCSGRVVGLSSLEEGLAYCHANSIGMFIEFKTGATQAEIVADYALAQQYHMENRIVWISFDDTILGYIKAIDDKARLQYLIDDEAISTGITKASALKTENNQVGIDVTYSRVTSSVISDAATAGLTVSVWTDNDHWDVFNKYNMGVKQFTTDSIRVEQILSTYKRVSGSEFVVGKIMAGYVHSLNTTDNTRVSYIGDAFKVKSGTSYSARVHIASGLSKTLEYGIQTFGGNLYRAILRGGVVGDSTASNKNDTGWKGSGAATNLKFTPGDNITSAAPCILAFTFHHTDNSAIDPSEVDYVEVFEYASVCQNGSY